MPTKYSIEMTIEINPLFLSTKTCFKKNQHWTKQTFSKGLLSSFLCTVMLKKRIPRITVKHNFAVDLNATCSQQFKNNHPIWCKVNLLCSCFICEIFNFLSFFTNNGTYHCGWYKNSKKNNKDKLVLVRTLYML